jgi:hypothetical protein
VSVHDEQAQAAQRAAIASWEQSVYNTANHYERQKYAVTFHAGWRAGAAYAAALPGDAERIGELEAGIERAAHEHMEIVGELANALARLERTRYESFVDAWQAAKLAEGDGNTIPACLQREADEAWRLAYGDIPLPLASRSTGDADGT